MISFETNCAKPSAEKLPARSLSRSKLSKLQRKVPLVHKTAQEASAAAAQHARATWYVFFFSEISVFI